MFCQKSELFFGDEEFPDFSALENLTFINIGEICDVQELRGFDDPVYRLNSDKLLNWLQAKAQRISKYLSEKNSLLSEREALIAASSILIEYLDQDMEAVFLNHLKYFFLNKSVVLNSFCFRITKEDLESNPSNKVCFFKYSIQFFTNIIFKTEEIGII
jgi:hypothetical protein